MPKKRKEDKRKRNQGRKEEGYTKKLIILFLAKKDKKISAREINEHMNKYIGNRTIKTHLEQLEKRGFVEKIESKKGLSHFYKLTDDYEIKTKIPWFILKGDDLKNEDLEAEFEKTSYCKKYREERYKKIGVLIKRIRKSTVENPKRLNKYNDFKEMYWEDIIDKLVENELRRQKKKNENKKGKKE